MITLTTLLAVLTALFIVFLFVRAAGVKVCAACAAVATAWLGLLALYYVGRGVDPLMISVLMGGSVVGATYFLREKLPEAYQLFTFPFLVTSFSFAYLLLADIRTQWEAYIFLAGLWVVFAFFFFARESDTLKSTARKLIECCKNW